MSTSLALAILALGAGLASAPATELAASAQSIEAPIAEVTVYGDRASALRSGVVDLSEGTNVIAFPDLPGGTLLDTVRVTADGASILRVETNPVEKLRSGIERVEAILEEIEALDEKMAKLNGQNRTLEQELSWLASITPAPLPDSPEAPRHLAPDIWPLVLDLLETRRSEAREKVRALAVERREVARDREEALSRLRKLDLGGITERSIEVLAVVHSPRARRRVPVSVEYMVPGAGWTPAYELHFEPRTEEVTLKGYGRVRQATGEDWSDVRLSLSTATPARGIEMPVLLTWILGEARDFVPVPRPKQRPDRPTFHDLPAPSVAELAPDSEARAASVRERLSALRVQPEASERPRPTRRQPPRAARPAPDYAPPEEMLLDMEMEASVMAESPAPRSSRIRRERASVAAESTRSQPPEKGFVLADPSEQLVPPLPPAGSPAALSEGLDFVYPVAATSTLDASGEHHRVPLFRESFSTDLLYEISPGLEETAFLKASVRNTGERPILGGPASLFVSGSYAGDSRLETIGPGGMVELPLGADEDVRVRRVVTFNTVTTGLVRREEATDYTHRIELVSHKETPIRLRVTDQVPKTRNESIRIETGAIDPKPAEGPTETEGLVHWDIELEPGDSTSLELRYRVRRPSNWRLFQR